MTMKLLLAGAALALAGVSTIALAGFGSPPAPAVPAAIDAGPQVALVATLAARGVQVYECRAGQGPGVHAAWAFVAPEAELLDAEGRVVGHHGAGPSWQAGDGSRVDGLVQARAEVPGAIPWLLLTATAGGAPGRFSGVSHVQRVDTHGGLPPVAPCTKASLGRTERVPYTAVYHFLTRRS
jgi:hypothetical protein